MTSFQNIDPPFNLNDPAIAQYPVEVSGYRLLKSMADRLGGDSFRDRRVYDFGCGVRFARTIANLDLEFAQYSGIDVNADAICWLQEHLPPARFQFAQLDARNPLYNPDGVPLDAMTELPLPGQYDAACMFSVITHQAPDEAEAIFRLLRRSITPDRLYFTAFIDPTISDFAELAPHLRHRPTYHPNFLAVLLSKAGWRIDAAYPISPFQRDAFVCSPR